MEIIPPTNPTMVPITGRAERPKPAAVLMLLATPIPAPAADVATFVSVNVLFVVAYPEQAFALDAPVAVV